MAGFYSAGPIFNKCRFFGTLFAAACAIQALGAVWQHLQPFDTNFPATFAAIPVLAAFNARQRPVNLGQLLACGLAQRIYDLIIFPLYGQFSKI